MHQSRNVLRTTIGCIVFILAVVCIRLTANAATLDITSKGWYNPIDSMQIISTGTFNSAKYLELHGKRHTGIDLSDFSGKSQAVYAIDDGEITNLYRDPSATENLSVICIKHTTSEDKVFYAVYGHTYAASSLKIGSKVKIGQQIGSTRHFNSYHLHFGVNVNTGTFSHWGTSDKQVDPESLGWRDPSVWLKSNASYLYWNEERVGLGKSFGEKNVDYAKQYSFIPRQTGYYTFTLTGDKGLFCDFDILHDQQEGGSYWITTGYTICFKLLAFRYYNISPNFSWNDGVDHGDYSYSFLINYYRGDSVIDFPMNSNLNGKFVYGGDTFKYKFTTDKAGYYNINYNGNCPLYITVYNENDYFSIADAPGYTSSARLNEFTWKIRLKENTTYYLDVVGLYDDGDYSTYCTGSYTLTLSDGSLQIDDVSCNGQEIMVGKPITWEVTTIGGLGDKLYQFLLYKNGKMIATQKYGKDSAFTFTPTEAGTYKVRAYVKDSTGTVAKNSANVIVSPPLSITSVKANKSSVDVGTAITWKATADGGDGTKTYRFLLYKDGELLTSSKFTTAATYKYTPKVAGTYKVRAYVKDSTGTVSMNSAIVIVKGPLSITSVKANKTSAAVGTAITWKTTAAGGSGTKAYRFLLYKDGKLLTTSKYTSAATYKYTPDKPGVYKVRAYVKDKTGTVSMNSKTVTVE